MKERTLATLGVIAIFLFALVAPVGCAPSPGPQSPQRETARAVVITMAKVTANADQFCASLATTQKDAPLAKKCADAYDIARPALLAAEASVDAWESGAKNDVACSASKATTALSKVAEAITAAGGKVPLEVVDALKFATSITGECHGS